jgi:hypothetical protein
VSFFGSTHWPCLARGFFLGGNDCAGPQLISVVRRACLTFFRADCPLRRGFFVDVHHVKTLEGVVGRYRGRRRRKRLLFWLPPGTAHSLQPGSVMRGLLLGCALACATIPPAGAEPARHLAGRVSYGSCLCDFNNPDRSCDPVMACYSQGGRCRGLCTPRSVPVPHPLY